MLRVLSRACPLLVVFCLAWPLPARATYRAVLVGVSDYQHPDIQDLPYCDKDAEDVGAKLQAVDPAHWSASNIDIVTNSEATRTGIYNALMTMKAAAQPGDVCLFFFSGHGCQGWDEYPLDESDGIEEYICAHDTLPTDYSGDIRDDALGDWFDGFPTSNLCVILDSCFSGGMAARSTATPKCIRKLFLPPNLPAAPGDGFAADLVAPRVGIKDIDSRIPCEVLMACEEDEVSWIDCYRTNSLFTYYVVDGIASPVTAQELFDYAAPRATNRADYCFSEIMTPRFYDNYLAGSVQLTGACTTPPTCDITFTPSSPCPEQQVEFDSHAAACDPVTSVVWDFGDGQVGSGVTTTHAYATGGTYTVGATVTDSSARTGSCSTAVTVDDVCHCTGYDIDDTVEYSWESTSGATCLWLEDDDYQQIAIGFPFDYCQAVYDTLSVGSNGIVYFGAASIEYENGCLPLDNAGASRFIAPFWDDLDPTSGGLICYEVKGTAPNRRLVIEWDGVPRFLGTNGATFEVILYETTGNIKMQYLDTVFGSSSYDYGASATIGVQCSGTEADEYSCNIIAVHSGDAILFSPCVDVTCDIAFSPSAPSVGETVTFDGNPSGGTEPYTYQWEFGDGDSSTDAAPTHAYTAGGSYTVSLSVTDSGQATGSCSTTVTVNAPPTCDITCTPPAPAWGEVVGFDSNANDPDGAIASALWDFGDGQTGSGVTTSHTYMTVDQFTAVCTVTDDQGAIGVCQQNLTVSPQLATQSRVFTGDELGWHLISLPLEPADPAPAAVFASSGYDPLGRLYRYDVCRRGYVGLWPGDPDGFGDMNEHTGYWLNVGEPFTLSYVGLRYPPQDIQCAIALCDEFYSWMLIGTGMESPVSLSTHASVCQNGGGPIPLCDDDPGSPDAHHENWVLLPFYGWSPTTVSYYCVSAVGGPTCDLDALDPWQGYWADVEQPDLALIFAPP